MSESAWTVWAIISIATATLLTTLLLPKMWRGLLSHSLTQLHHFYYKSSLLHNILAVFSRTQARAPSGLPPVEKMERVAGNVTRVLGLNPGPHTLQGTNTYLLGSSSAKILIDTGEGKTAKEYISFLFDEVFPNTKTTSLSHILLTHGHDDHQGGISELFSELKKRNMLPLPNVYKYQSPSGSFPVKRFSSVQNIRNGDTFSTDGATVQAMYAPGHTDDHVCFILKENEALLSGDCILGCGSAVFEDLHSYMNSLKRLRSIMKDGYPWVLESDANCSMLSITSIFPGHGPVLSSSVIEKVDEYIAHREERERQIVDYLRSHCTPTMSWRSSWEVMSNIYPSTLPLIVKMSAQYNVQHHLSKLVVDGVVTSAWPDLWKVTNADYK